MLLSSSEQSPELASSFAAIIAVTSHVSVLIILQFFQGTRIVTCCGSLQQGYRAVHPLYLKRICYALQLERLCYVLQLNKICYVLQQHPVHMLPGYPTWRHVAWV